MTALATPNADTTATNGRAATILEQPLVSFGPEIAGDLHAALRREWLVTNGLGGYASATVAGVNTRRYHGLLVAALTPPVERTVLIAGSVDWVLYDGHRYSLSTHEYGDGTIDPHGYSHIQLFELDGTIPVWTFAVGDALIQKRVWMEHGANTTYVTYRMVRGSPPLDLDVSPLVTHRGFHELGHGGWVVGVAEQTGGIEVHAFDGATPFRILAPGSRYARVDAWYWNFLHREETTRGLDDRSDLYVPGSFSKRLRKGDELAFLLSTERRLDTSADHALDAQRWRQRVLLGKAGAVRAQPVLQQLTLAADQFIVRRDVDARPGSGSTVIAGYHWFNDWGRDTMISLPGLTLSTGRAQDAASILRTFAPFVDRGMLPNNFPDRAGALPGYNTVDATLWYILAVARYETETGDRSVVDELLPVVRSIIDWHVRGTRFGIGVDRDDGLLHAGEPGVQLTWMDAKVGEWVVTPRIGKPVEVQALWYSALRSVAEMLSVRNDNTAADDYGAMAERVRESFHRRFFRSDLGYLADVVDGPNGDELQLRPNQIFAISLPHALLDGADAVKIVDAVGRALLTGLGLRSLDSTDSAYRGDYRGDPVRRDGSYHQGPVWTWLLGPYAEAHFRVHGDRAAALTLLRPVEHHLRDACLGSVSEILEGDAPNRPVGCVAQAWGVAETLRVLRMLTEDEGTDV